MHSQIQRLQRTVSLIVLLLLGACGSTGPTAPEPLRLGPLQASPRKGERIWLGATLWGNRLQDWRFCEGRIECVTPTESRGGWLPMRTAHELAQRLDGRRGGFRVSVGIDRLTPAASGAADAVGGLLIGAGGPEMDPRAAALVHQWRGPGAGILVGLDAGGRLHIEDWNLEEDVDAVVAGSQSQELPDTFRLTVTAEALTPARLRLVAWVTDPARDVVLATAAREFPAQRLVGNVALVSHPGTRSDDLVAARFGFRHLRIRGEGSQHDPEAGLGPIVGTQYTLSRRVLKLTAQLMPMGSEDPQAVYLEVWRDGHWKPLAEEDLVVPGWTVTFRVADWDADEAVPYRVRYALPSGDALGSTLTYTWPGLIRRDPKHKDELVLAVLNCNHNNSHAIGGGWGLGQAPDRTAPNDWIRGMWFPHTDITRAVADRAPDLLFFAGDQVYEGKSPSFADRATIELDYLYKWNLFLWAFRDLTAVTPTVTIPDDHDIYQGNLWGAGGRAAERDNEGGYVHPAAFVRLVERTQTSHLPDPFDPTPVEQGIGVYYSHLVWGGVSFAILEDRKFKSGCRGVLPSEITANRPDHVIDPDWDPGIADLAGLELLGGRQEDFLATWASDWKGARMKAVLSQSPFACLSTHHGANLTRYEADLDANGWPQSGRRRALRRIRSAKAVHITGDQHLAIVAQHGLDQFGDGPWSFTGPAIANFYPRAWAPSQRGAYRALPPDQCTGNFLDGFGNRVSVAAVANPGSSHRPEGPSDLFDRMPGFGCAVFHKGSRQVTFECWPRGVLPSAPDAWQYPGWPVTVDPR